MDRNINIYELLIFPYRLEFSRAKIEGTSQQFPFSQAIYPATKDSHFSFGNGSPARTVNNKSAVCLAP